MTGESDLPPDLATRADDLLRTRPNADQLAGMSTHAFEASRLDHDTLVLVWLAALVALDAPIESYLMNLGAASQTAVSVERVHQRIGDRPTVVTQNTDGNWSEFDQGQ